MQEVILWNDDNTEYHVADVLVGTEDKGLIFENAYRLNSARYKM